jgi:hypothetical protein
MVSNKEIMGAIGKTQLEFDEAAQKYFSILNGCNVSPEKINAIIDNAKKSQEGQKLIMGIVHSISNPIKPQPLSGEQRLQEIRMMRPKKS